MQLQKINTKGEKSYMADFGLNLAMWILGIAGEHDADGWLSSILDLLQ